MRDASLQGHKCSVHGGFESDRFCFGLNLLVILRQQKSPIMSHAWFASQSL